MKNLSDNYTGIFRAKLLLGSVVSGLLLLWSLRMMNEITIFSGFSLVFALGICAFLNPFSIMEVYRKDHQFEARWFWKRIQFRLGEIKKIDGDWVQGRYMTKLVLHCGKEILFFPLRDEIKRDSVKNQVHGVLNSIVEEPECHKDLAYDINTYNQSVE